ncbi:hypothetical protein ACIP1G_05360 [Pseudomonas sp. NPDC089392]|uniref:hypothetical protein n=1 Tax=Pseudomonas sp. NPDC089392 TaxID=3364459 RepID=UPI0037F4467F
MLHDLLQRIWAVLAIPAGPVRNPYRLMQLSTLDEQGWPVSRTVVLRDVDALAGTLYFYADRRSAKKAPTSAVRMVSSILRSFVSRRGRWSGWILLGQFSNGLVSCAMRHCGNPPGWRREVKTENRSH